MVRRILAAVLLYSLSLGVWGGQIGSGGDAVDVPVADWHPIFNQGKLLQREGKNADAVGVLREAKRLVDVTDVMQDKAEVAAALGASLQQAGWVADAEPVLLEAHAGLSGTEQAAVANDLGNLYYGQRRSDMAARYYRQAIEQSDPQSVLWLSASLNVVRTRPSERRLDVLRALRPRIDRLSDSVVAASLLLNLGTQAQALGKSGLALAFDSLSRARELAQASGHLRYQMEAIDALSQLYESSGRWNDVLALTDSALKTIHGKPTAGVEDVLLQLEWRKGRAYRALHQDDSALAAYQRAVELAQQIRQDLPIELADGRTSFKQILEPLHMGYIELQLDSLSTQPGVREQVVLERVRDAIEVLRQSEMQDFLGDRCSVEAATADARIEASTAIVYPILLKNRVELLIETSTGLSRQSVAIGASRVRDSARDFASALRAGDNADIPAARRLYDALIKPAMPFFTEQQIKTLVIVSEGELRLVPFAALRSEEGFLIEHFAVATVTGMSLTNMSPMTGGTPRSLLAGVAEPGGVVDKLTDIEVLRSASGPTRGIRLGGSLGEGKTMRAVTPVNSSELVSRDLRAAELRKSLTLKGVEAEVNSIGAALSGKVLLDGDFTVDRFRDEAEAGGYRIVHIASHGVFGGSAETSFILAYDDLLSINRLQTVLQSEAMQSTPIELLTLSACETAEGNDRAPLGIAGAAIRARAKSVLGTLWPVEDNAARKTMETFYAGIVARKSKVEALQQAQLRLIHDPELSHPFFWAPFSLIGNWR